MPLDNVLARGEFVMTVCNACRYCEQYCPVFPAMEQRTTFATGDLTYLANLCHNCGECLYACQYAPPHEFGINVPKTLAEIRVRSYEAYCWPAFLGAAFRRNSLSTALALVLGLAAVLLGSAWATHAEGLWQSSPAGDFYSVMPHDVMVAMFGSVSAFVLLAFGVGLRRFWREVHGGAVGTPVRPSPTAARHALRDLLTLGHLHTTGVDCPSGVETRSSWRRWFHHCTFYGFMLCFASTSVAAIYDGVFGWVAPYGYASLPVLLGTLGGLGLLIGPVGLLALKRQRDPELGDTAQKGMDESFIVLLLVTSVTGIALLLLRNQPVMGVLLMVHLGSVLALFVTLPYGKFVHGIYRTAALLKYASERETEG
jgi:citrate/tricarballylate utilization protein